MLSAVHVKLIFSFYKMNVLRRLHTIYIDKRTMIFYMALNLFLIGYGRKLRRVSSNFLIIFQLYSDIRSVLSINFAESILTF